MLWLFHGFKSLFLLFSEERKKKEREKTFYDNEDSGDNSDITFHGPIHRNEWIT